MVPLFIVQRGTWLLVVRWNWIGQCI